MVVNLEIYLFQNFSMNCLILALALRLSRRKMYKVRVFLASILGTVYALLSCLQSFSFLQRAPFQLLGMPVMCLITLRDLRPLEFLRLCGFCCIVSALLGGTGFGVMHILGSRGFDLPTALLTILIGSLCAFTLSSSFYKTAPPVHLRRDVHLQHTDGNLSLEGYTDTGNTLLEPLSGLPVMLISQELFTPPKETAFRPVPFEAMGSKGIVDAFFPEKLTVDGKRKYWYVAAYPGRLPFGALLPLDAEKDEKE